MQLTCGAQIGWRHPKGCDWRLNRCIEITLRKIYLAQLFGKDRLIGSISPARPPSHPTSHPDDVPDDNACRHFRSSSPSPSLSRKLQHHYQAPSLCLPPHASSRYSRRTHVQRPPRLVRRGPPAFGNTGAFWPFVRVDRMGEARFCEKSGAEGGRPAQLWPCCFSFVRFF